MSKPSCQLILALDLPDQQQALNFLDKTGGQLQWVKIGLQLFTKHGPDFVKAVADKGYKIFLDLKLHDIPNTVASSVKSLSQLPIELLTLHTAGGSEMMRAAVQAAQETAPNLKLLGVTVLTSMDEAGLQELSISQSPQERVVHLAKLGVEAGLPGLVCSALELPVLRKELGPSPLLVTPGIRPAGSATDEQKRVTTPKDAAQQGASFIVVGRPILKAQDPQNAVETILTDLHLPATI
tara:strand:+ start:2013 stop:2726 length:714 start_codon:yes stop_codon:yes gene_type:complete